MLKKTTIGCRLCRWYIQLQKPLHSHLTESITCQKPLHSKTSTLFDKGVFEIVSKCNVWKSEHNGNYLTVCL